MGTEDSRIIACRTSSKLTPPVERSLTVSAPYLTASFSFSTSSLISLALGDAPILALTLQGMDILLRTWILLQKKRIYLLL